MKNICIIGDSHMARLRNSGKPLPIRGNITWRVRSGAKIEFLRDVVEDVITRNQDYDLVIVSMGGNDLDSPFVIVNDLIQKFVNELIRLLTKTPLVLFMEQWPRPGARFGPENYWTNVERFQHEIRCSSPVGIRLWSWDNSLRYPLSFYSRDLVHCHPRRYKKVARYLTSAILCGLKWFGQMPVYGNPITH